MTGDVPAPTVPDEARKASRVALRLRTGLTLDDVAMDTILAAAAPFIIAARGEAGAAIRDHVPVEAVEPARRAIAQSCGLDILGETARLGLEAAAPFIVAANQPHVHTWQPDEATDSGNVEWMCPAGHRTITTGHVPVATDPPIPPPPANQPDPREWVRVEDANRVLAEERAAHERTTANQPDAAEVERLRAQRKAVLDWLATSGVTYGAFCDLARLLDVSDDDVMRHRESAYGAYCEKCCNNWPCETVTP